MISLFTLNRKKMPLGEIIWGRVIDFLKVIGPWVTAIVAGVIGIEWKSWRLSRIQVESDKKKAQSELLNLVTSLVSETKELRADINNTSALLSSKVEGVSQRLDLVHSDLKSLEHRVTKIEDKSKN